jgi:AcrR family transcriptional regulator
MTSSERREAILDAAIRLFSERGFRGTTTRELAAAVGVSEPVLYQHFQTKRDLYRALIERKIDEGGDRAQASLEQYTRVNDDRGFFAGLGHFILAWYREDPAYVRLLHFSALEGHELSEIFYERFALTFYNFVADYLRRRMEEGAFRRMEPMLAARAFAGMVAHHGLASTVFRCNPVPLGDSEIVDGMVTIFLGGISAK